MNEQEQPNLEELGKQITDTFVGLARMIKEAEAKINAATAITVHQLSDIYFDKKGAARYLGRSVSTVERYLASKNPLPHYRLGGKVFFRPSDIDAWLNQYRFPRK